LALYAAGSLASEMAVFTAQNSALVNSAYITNELYNTGTTVGDVAVQPEDPRISIAAGVQNKLLNADVKIYQGTYGTDAVAYTYKLPSLKNMNSGINGNVFAQKNEIIGIHF